MLYQTEGSEDHSCFCFLINMYVGKFFVAGVKITYIYASLPVEARLDT